MSSKRPITVTSGIEGQPGFTRSSSQRASPIIMGNHQSNGNGAGGDANAFGQPSQSRSFASAAAAGYAPSYGARGSGGKVAPAFNLEDEDEGTEASYTQDELYRTRDAVRAQDKFVLEETETRNVIMVGRTRSGKTTAIGVIKDTCFEPKEMCLFSDTVKATFQSFALVVKEHNVKMTLNLIDTPGLYERKARDDDMQARDNDALLGVIDECMRHEITKVHCVVLFASFETGITREDVEAVGIFKKMFSTASIVLCITRCEDKPESWKQTIKANLAKTDEFAEFVDKIFWMGCFDPSTNSADSSEKMAKTYKRIYAMRRKLLDYILQCKNPVEISRMGKQLFEPVKTLLEELCDFYRHALEAGRDFTTQAFQSQCAATQQLLDELAAKSHLLQSAELTPLTDEFHRLAKEVNKLNMPQECKHKVLGLIRFASK